MSEISIVLPVYNGGDFIAQAIESILQQTFNDFELILVNDCSTDNTSEIISAYERQDKRIRIINNNENKKLPASLNIGFRKANGTYLTWTSHDNLYKPEALECMYTELEEHSEYGMVYADYSIIDDQGKLIKDNVMNEPKEICKGNVIGACFLYRRNIAQQVGEYSENMFLAEDYDYWLRIYQCASLKHIHQNLYLYRLHGKSLSSLKLDAVKRQMLLLWEKHFDFIIQNLQSYKDLCEFYDLLCSYSSEGEGEELKELLIEKRPVCTIHAVKKNIYALLKEQVYIKK